MFASLPFDFPGPSVPPNFASFSVEPYALFDWTGRFPQPVRPAFVRLMEQLHPTPSSPGPVLRLGGNGADMASYNPQHQRRAVPPYGRGLWYDVTDNDLQSIAQTAEALRSKVVLGINFRDPSNASVAIDWLRAVEREVGWERVEAIEIGNEPDVYEWTQLRPAGYDLSAYIDEWTLYARALHDALPSLPEPILQGGAFGSLAWAPQWHRFMSRARNFLKSLSFHHYPLSLCQGGTPTVHRLLSDHSSQGAARALMRSQALTHAQGYGLPLVVSEGSSVSCGRMPGVSNSYAAALWAIDEMLVDASVGIRSWHFHYAGGNTTLTYSPLVRQATGAGKDGVLQVLPIYYGLRFFALATANHSTIYRVNITDSSNAHVKVYSLITKRGDVHVVLLHKDASTMQDAVVALRLAIPVAFSALPYASVVRLTAPSASSVHGVRLAGQTYDGSVDGGPVGEEQREWLKPADGLYTVRVGRLSAVLLRLDVDGPYHMDDPGNAARSTEGVSAPADGEALSLSSSDEELTVDLASDGDDGDRATDGGGGSATVSGAHEDNTIAALVDAGAGMSASRRSARAAADEEAMAMRPGESWKAPRRGKFAMKALNDAKTNYATAMEEHIERALSDRRRGH